ncbi:MAG: alkaline phosphatase PhoX [Gammaproteobacteria bacterium]
MLTRRGFLAAGAASAFIGLRVALGSGVNTAASGKTRSPFGPPLRDPDRLLDLPRGFSYTIISRAGQRMDDGLYVPGAHDGMAAFDAGDGNVALVCNHELEPFDIKAGPFGPNQERLRHIARDRLYDAGGCVAGQGGATTLIYDPRARRVERQFLCLAGTERNCAGGATPWGAWLSCEETAARADFFHGRDHGWVFEVPADARAPVDPAPLKAMGRFRHEAVAIDPATGVLYLTEDEDDSLIYRFLPQTPGRLAAGGRLQALALAERKAADTRNWPGGSENQIPENTPLDVRWLDLDEVESPRDDLRMRGHAAGAALFARGEGICFGNGELYFCCTSGGALGAGQIFRYRPSAFEGASREREAPRQLELFVESADRRALDNCDNLTMTPWGDLMVCEDANTPCSLVGVTPDGGLYRFAENAHTPSELAGVCFSPDGRTLFVNIQKSGLTLAIAGPFPGSPELNPRHRC